MNYATFDFYTQVYQGVKIPEPDFDKWESRAEAVISYLTFLNGDIFAEESDRVKLAVCAAAESIYMTESTGGGGITASGLKSESNDGYSVTYVTDAQDGDSPAQAERRRVLGAIRQYLLPTGWLSRRCKT